MSGKAKQVVRLASRGFAIVAIVRQVRKARADGDTLRLLDAVANALAILTAVAIILRELRDLRERAEAEAP